MPPRPSYADRVYTTSVVGYEGMTHITGDEQGNKDFTPLIEHALALGGYAHDRSMSGINGGHMLTTGFAHGAMLANAEKVISAIKAGAIKHIFLVGGCDGAHPGRNYYTEFVKQTPMDTLVLTLACGKYRFNDLDLGQTVACFAVPWNQEYVPWANFPRLFFGSSGKGSSGHLWASAHHRAGAGYGCNLKERINSLIADCKDVPKAV